MIQPPYTITPRKILPVCLKWVFRQIYGNKNQNFQNFKSLKGLTQRQKNALLIFKALHVIHGRLIIVDRTWQ